MIKHDFLITDLTILKDQTIKTDFESKLDTSEIVTNIAIKDEKISYIGSEKVDALQHISAKGLHGLSCLIDSQVHFRDPGLTHKEDLETGSLSTLTGGLTGFFEMPNTKPSTTTSVLFEEKLSLARQKSWTNYAFYAGASQKNYSELQVMEKIQGCCGTKIFMGSSTGDLLVSEDADIKEVLSHLTEIVAVHSEDENRLIERKDLAIKAADSRFHPEWRDVESAVRSTKRILRLAAELKKKVHLLHVTTEEEFELIQDFKNRYPGLLTVEVLPQHLTLQAPDCYERLGSLAQMNPPIRDIRHQKALWKALSHGLVDVIGSDHAPHTIEEKNKAYPNSPSGMPGSQTLLPVMLNHVHNKKISLAHLTRLLSKNVIDIFKIKSRGLLQVGSLADLTIIDLKARWKIENSQMKTKCGWTPFDNFEVIGKPIHTFVNGHWAMKDSQIANKPIIHAYEFQKNIS